MTDILMDEPSIPMHETPTGFSQNYTAARRQQEITDRKSSELAAQGEVLQGLSELVYGTPDAWREQDVGPSIWRKKTRQQQEKLLADANEMAKLDPGKFGDQPLTSADVERRAFAKLSAEMSDLDDVLRRGGDYSGVGAVLGGLREGITNPVNLMMMPFGVSGGTGRVIAGEAGMGAVAEILLHPQRMRVSSKIDRPAPDLGDNVLMGAVGGAVFAGGLVGGQRAVAYGVSRMKTEQAASNVDAATTDAEVTRAVEDLKAGRPLRGIRNNNPGNIERGGDNWKGMIGDDGRFLQFASPEEGIRAIVRTLDTYQTKHGLSTIDQIVHRWAPPSENNSKAYVDDVAAEVGIGPNDTIAPEHIPLLVKAIIKHENGKQPYSDDQISAGIAMASRDAEISKAYPAVVDDDPRLAPSRDTVSISPNDIRTDAETYQFKADGDQEGVTNRLQGVKTWDSVRAGKLLIHQRNDGKFYVADGHQRLGLAKRLSSDGQDIRIDATIVKEADGHTPADVMARAAARNIAEGTGSAIDAAKVLRVRPDMIDNLPPQSALVRDADGLMKLTGDNFLAVVKDVIPQNYGAIIGQMTPDADLQAALITTLSRTQPANALQARTIAADALAAGRAKAAATDQGSLFGGVEPSDTLYLDRAKVLDTALRRLRNDKKVFGTLTKEAQRIEGAGNKLNAATNKTRADTDAQTIEIIQKLATRAGPVSDALTDAAGKLRAGDKSGVDGFIDAIRGSVASGDFGGVQGRGGERAPDAPKAGGSPSRTGTTDNGSIDLTPEGQQRVIPGTEKITDAELAQRQIGRAMQGGDATPPEGGLFSPEGPELFDGLTPESDALLDSLEADARSIENLEDITVTSEDGSGFSAREALDDIEADREFVEQINLCRPDGTMGAKA